MAQGAKCPVCCSARQCYARKKGALLFRRWKWAEVKQKSLSANIQIRITFPSDSWVIEFCQSQESIKRINTHIVHEHLAFQWCFAEVST